MVDKALEANGNDDLQGKTAIANAKIAYALYNDLFSGVRWAELAEAGARPQRLLWASTSTKDPAYPDTMYVDGLIGPETVNTAPPLTVEAFMDHGTVAITLTVGIDEAREQLAQLKALGIDLDHVTDTLQVDGVVAFADAFAGLMESIDVQRRQILAEDMRLSWSVPGHEDVVQAGLDDLSEQDIVSRIWAHDHTVWKPEPTEITNRLDWLTIADEMRGNLDRLRAFAAGVRAAGYTDVVLLGMGGSSLAPEVFSTVFGAVEGHPRLTILDSTDPGMVLDIAADIDLSKTLFVVATKSGGTAETLSAFKYFYNQVADTLGAADAGDHFVAITDPGSSLVDLAQTHNFRDIFLNNPNIGGRYSALSYFGLVPAALLGIDLARLLDQARIAACNAGGAGCPPAQSNSSALLGVLMGELAGAGHDKLTLITSPVLDNFGDWVEQLVAESTGKDGKGILPVVREQHGAPGVYGDDRLFIYLRLDGDSTFDAQVDALKAAGQPVVTIPVANNYELGRQFFLWEMATAIAGQRLGIQPFDQPNVEEAKVQARQMIASYQESGTLPEVEALPAAADGLHTFLSAAKPGDYISIQAYIQPSPAADGALAKLRTQLRDIYHLPVTVGYGPRFLHSTGQLHKGDAGNGFFIQLIADMPRDIAIPDEAGSPESHITFGVLKTAQALGDGNALRQAGRPVVLFDLGSDIVAGIDSLLG